MGKACNLYVSSRRLLPVATLEIGLALFSSLYNMLTKFRVGM